jgi:hypothetical protein
VAQGVDPEFKPQYGRKKKKKERLSAFSLKSRPRKEYPFL